jgi:hypothetical protein
MSLLDANPYPSRRELKWFGVILAVLFGVVGATLRWRTGSAAVAAAVWSAGAILVGVYLALPPFRCPIYRAWMAAVRPLGWLLSHAMLGLVFLGAVTPTGLLLRLRGRDPIRRRFDPGAGTYWEPHDPGADPTRYFRQF